MFCFFLGVLSAFLTSTQKRKVDAELFELFAIIFLLASAIFTISAFIMKKLRRRKKRRHHSHGREDRAVMTPYTETEGYKRVEKDEEAAEPTSEPTSEEERSYQIYTISPKRKKGKNKKASKGLSQ